MADGVVVGSALVDILGRDGVGAAGRFLDLAAASAGPERTDVKVSMPRLLARYTQVLSVGGLVLLLASLLLSICDGSIIPSLPRCWSPVSLRFGRFRSG